TNDEARADAALRNLPRRLALEPAEELIERIVRVELRHLRRDFLGDADVDDGRAFFLRELREVEPRSAHRRACSGRRYWGRLRRRGGRGTAGDHKGNERRQHGSAYRFRPHGVLPPARMFFMAPMVCLEP